MTKKSHESDSDEAKSAEDAKPVAVDSDEREGNDIPSLIGSGAPMLKIRARTNYMGLAPGQVGTFIQTEELRLGIQNGLAEQVSD